MDNVLELNAISKSFGGVHALVNVDLHVARGQVHAVLGENGAGKSTLMKVIAGSLKPDGGTITLEGELVSFRGPKDAADRGIAIVYQEPTYFGELSVLENFYVGDEATSRFGVIRWDHMAAEATFALEQMELSPRLLARRMSELSIGTQQLVLIAKGIHKRARLLILDEPTSILSQAETDTLFKTVRKLKQQGVSVLYISHRLQEIFEIADHITVLRDGQKTSEMLVSDATEEKLIRSMTGREMIHGEWTDRPNSEQPPLLEVNSLGSVGYFSDVSFSLRPGEVLGVYGLVGAGRTELATAIVGELKRDAGTVRLEGRPFAPKSLREALSHGVVYMPEDRNTQGLFLTRSVRENLSAGFLPRVSSRLGWIDFKSEAVATAAQVDALKIKAESQESVVRSLSGGNQQKVVLGRGLLQQPRVFILDEPTRGIDVGTKREIHRLIRQLSQNGFAILLISSDLPEIMAVSDTVMVMHEGLVTGSFDRSEASEERIVKLALALQEEQ